jgi:hypothetical protein
MTIVAFHGQAELLKITETDKLVAFLKISTPPAGSQKEVALKLAALAGRIYQLAQGGKDIARNHKELATSKKILSWRDPDSLYIAYQKCPNVK